MFGTLNDKRLQKLFYKYNVTRERINVALSFFDPGNVHTVVTHYSSYTNEMRIRQITADQ